MSQVWHLSWAFGELDIHARGGMLAGVKLKLAGNRSVEPFYEAAWIAPGSGDSTDLLANLRSEFPCVPFGGSYPAGLATPEWTAAQTFNSTVADAPFDATDELLHGYGAVGLWTLVEQTAAAITIAIDYPQSSPIRRLTRVVRVDPSAARINFSVTVDVRAPTRRPVGLHPNLKLPKTVGALQLSPGPYKFGVVHPGGPEPGVSKAKLGATFADLKSVPLADGKQARFDQLPFAAKTEEIVQLCGIDGTLDVLNTELNAKYRLTWDAKVMPSILLWISNGGRAYPPWDGNNMCVGIEPVCAAFDLGVKVSLADNPINRAGVPTAQIIVPGTPLVITSSFAAQGTSP